MYFDCCHDVRFDNCHYPLPSELGGLTLGSIRKSSFTNLQHNDHKYNIWRALVIAYTETDLSWISDTLPAISGLASDFHRAIGGQYLAGLWKEDIIMSLAWSLSIEDKQLDTAYTAPSWSWASARNSRPSLQRNGKVFYTDVEILVAQVSLAGLDPFGAVTDGYLRIQARAQVATTRKKQVNSRHPHYFVYPNEAQGCTSQSLGRYFPDSETEDNARVMLVYLAEISPSTSMVPNQLFALAVEPISHRANSFRRIGFVNTWYNETDLVDKEVVPSNFRKHFASTDRIEILLY
jgi:hypothetical protein